MKTYHVENTETGALIASEGKVADTFSRRLVGLLGRRQLSREEALILTPCNSVHTFFMSFPIDVIFLNRRARVVACLKNMLPNRISNVNKDAVMAIEIPSGTIVATGTEIGHLISLSTKEEAVNGERY